MKKYYRATREVIKAIILFLIYYVGCVWRGLTIQRKSYNFETWLQTEQLIMGDTRKFIIFTITITLISIFGWINAFLIGVSCMVVLWIVSVLIKKIKHGKIE